MAQALFDEHPLGEYLRDAGESPAIMPGISVELEQEIDIHYGLLDDSDFELKHSDCYPQILVEVYLALQSAIPSWHHHPPPHSFVERFKYNIISSSLLSPSLQGSHTARIPKSPSIPGKLHHSRTSSIDVDPPISPIPRPNSNPSYGLISTTVACVAILFSIGYGFLAMIALSAIIIPLYKTVSMTETTQSDMTPTLNTLDELTVAADAWDSVVQDALNVLENDELSQARGSSSAIPPSPIRIALLSCLQTTHTQCDNVRHLFSALTSPPELSQLSEMYAPPSPSASKITFTTESHPRPFSFPSPRPQSSQYPLLTPENKRSTWNGSYSSLAFAGSPTSSINRRKDKHRAHISDLLKPSIGSPTPIPVTHDLDPLSKVSENEDYEAEDSKSHPDDFFSPNHFGAAALDLRRKRKSGGMEVFRSPLPQYFSPDPFNHRSFRHSVIGHPQASPSKLTNVQPGRHPLSLSALHHTLQGAIAAKRYAASHLLALRFAEEDEEAYWEDVRSVMDLLTSALVDASTRLSEALDQADQQKLQDQQPTPNTTLSDVDTGEVSGDHLLNSDKHKRRRFDSRASFAPMPSHLSRFAAHVAAISSSLDDAWDHLDQCIAVLKNNPDPFTDTPSPSHRLRHSKSLSRILSSIPGAEPDSEEHEALQAYERLRRELGLALRECERGRERLLEIVYPPIASDEDEGSEDLPGLGHDASDESDKPDPTSPFSEDDSDSVPHGNVGGFPAAVTEGGEAVILDDVSAHLLMVTNAQHLPLPGIEEVFEAETDSKIVFSRERSRLTREERIRIAKAKRESGLGLAIGVGAADGECNGNVKRGVEKWGPGGEVVQELKDVIWKVGEKRRKMTDSAPGVHPLETAIDDLPPSSRS